MISVAFEAVIGLEIHAELEARSKMFCSCPVVDVLTALPNSAVCPVCTGMPGVLPVVNRRAVEYALRVALALECQVNKTSIFERKNYFYPDLPKGYQISQYQHPLAVDGRVKIRTEEGSRWVRIRRVHLEEDTGKSTHNEQSGEEGEESPGYSLVDLNRSGIPLLEIVTEPDLHSPAEVRAYAQELRSVLQYLGVNSGDMQKGVLRIEPNISVRPAGSTSLGTRTEVKNLNSFRALERSVAFEIQRQIEVIRGGGQVVQATVGWDEARQTTFLQRSKEEAEDYRYFPEPDLPPLIVNDAWIESVRGEQPELPGAKHERFQSSLGLNAYDAGVISADKAVADYFEAVLGANTRLDAKLVANWLTGDLFGQMNQAGLTIQTIPIQPEAFARLLDMLVSGELNSQSAVRVLGKMIETGDSSETIVAREGLKQISNEAEIEAVIQAVLVENPGQLEAYLQGKNTLENWFFGQVMRRTGSRANPSVVRSILSKKLAEMSQ